MDPQPIPFGVLLRRWREQRRMTQTDLALAAESSTRHLSCLETGKALPSREMVARLAEYLDIPLRDRNTLLLSAGFAPAFPERSLAGLEAAKIPGRSTCSICDCRLTGLGAPSFARCRLPLSVSDPLPGKLAAQSDLVISLYVTGAQGPTTGHGMAMQTNYAAAGDHAAEEGAANWTDPMSSWYWLDSVSVETAAAVGSVVTFGDSITDGWASTTDKNLRWPDYLSRRLQAASGSTVKGVANEGISGNKVLADGAGQSALNRMQRDVLSQPGVSTVFMLEGVNDIKAHSGVTAADMIAGYQQVIDRAHAAGLCVVGATVMPFKGWSEYDDAAEAVRQGVNTWIRTSGAFDAVADFDKVTRNPYDQQEIMPFLDGGDHLHPNDKGMAAMADSIDLSALQCDR